MYEDDISAFEQLQQVVQAAASAAEAQHVIDTFVQQHPVSPLTHGDEAIIWYYGPGTRVVLRGDMLQERSEFLRQLGDSRLWFHRGVYEIDARLDYHLLVDGEDIGDPRNPRSVPSGYGPRAELRMPNYAAPTWWQPQPDVPKGHVTTYESHQSSIYGTTHTVHVYTPAGYDPARHYASVYFHDGGDYLKLGNAATIFDNMIAAGKIPPCVAVFIDPSLEHGRMVDYDLNPRYASFVCDELVPWIDSQYATHTRPEHRVVAGASFGGLIALMIAHARPDVFGRVASQSGFVSRAGNAIIDQYRQVPPQPVAVHLIVGAYETHIGPLQHGSPEANFVRGNEAMRVVLAEQGYRHAYAMYPEGHSWGLWRAYLGDALAFLFNLT